MGWAFETEPEFQARLDWADRFLQEDVEPLDHVLGASCSSTPSATTRNPGGY